MNPAALAVIVNSALYLAGVIAAGLVTQHDNAWRAAIADVGLLYLGYLAQLNEWRPFYMIALGWMGATIILGALAGLSLLF